VTAVKRPEPAPEPADLPRAERALLELAVAWHGWDRGETSVALLAWKQTGASFARIFAAASDQLRRPDGSPDALRHAAAGSARRDADESPADGSAWAARARRMLEHRDGPEGDVA
jgi:hypothetical protein